MCHDYIQAHLGMVITKYKFSQLFSKAWLKSVTPSNIISGLKAVEYILSIRRQYLIMIHVHQLNMLVQKMTIITKDVVQCSKTMVVRIHNIITAPQIITTLCYLYLKKKCFSILDTYTEGYNLYDPRYIVWVKVSHPEEGFKNFVSLIDHFPDATTPEAVSMLLDAETLRTNSVSDFTNSPGDAINLTPVRTDNT